MHNQPGAWIHPQQDGDTLKNMMAMAMEEAKKCGASQSEVAASIVVGLATSVRLGEVDTVEFTRDKGFGVTVYFNQQKGSASTSETSAQAVQETVRAACDIARYTSFDPCAGLAEPAYLAQQFPDLSLYHPWELTPENAIVLAQEVEIGRAHV